LTGRLLSVGLFRERTTNLAAVGNWLSVLLEGNRERKNVGEVTRESKEGSVDWVSGHGLVYIIV